MTVTNMLRGRQVVAPLTNQSGGAVSAGDVVIVSAANDESFTTTTSASYNTTRVGVALDSIAAAAAGRILLEGYAPLINHNGSATREHYLFTHTVAKQATSASGYAIGAFGQVLKAGTSPSAFIFPVAQVGLTGITRSGATTDNHLALWNGSSTDSLKDGGAVSAGLVSTLMLTIDGGGVPITTGIKGDLMVDFACTINAWTLLADVSGAIVVDIWRDVLGNYPPTDADALPGSGKEPTISASGTNAQDTTITDWTSDDLSAGDILRFNVDSCTAITRCLVALKVTRV